ncbi:MAG: hypothetical protein Q7S09_05905 [bacterium]|nr:hypothetical protein [bacterium]
MKQTILNHSFDKGRQTCGGQQGTDRIAHEVQPGIVDVWSKSKVHIILQEKLQNLINHAEGDYYKKTKQKKLEPADRQFAVFDGKKADQERQKSPSEDVEDPVAQFLICDPDAGGVYQKAAYNYVNDRMQGPAI